MVCAVKHEELAKLGAYMKSLREDKGLVLEDVQKQYGVNNSFLSQIERGLKRPGPNTLRKLSQAYFVPLDELMVMYHHSLPTEIPDSRRAELYRKVNEMQDKMSELIRLINDIYK